MASALIVLFLSCWLAGQSGVSEQTIYRKPSISLSPSGGVPLGGAVTVRCSGWYQNMRFLLYKDGTLIVLQDVKPAGDLAEFPIRNVSRRDAGRYRCYYYHRQNSRFIMSHPSDPVELLVVETNYWKPSISLSPSEVVFLGAAVTVRCSGWYQNMRFRLYKDGTQIVLQDVKPAGDLAEVPIRNVSRRDAGRYRCYYYHCQNSSFIRSHPSDPVELAVVETYYRKPSISLSPSGGAPLGGNVTVRCLGWYQNMRFLMYKDGTQIVLQDVKPAGDLAEFPIRNVSQRDAGRYRCYYYHRQNSSFIRSHPSDPVELAVVDPSYPKPNISLSPSRGVPLGAAVTVRCWGQHQNVRFLLYKDGNLTARQDVEPAGNVAEFPIRNVSRRDAGSYRCYYHDKWYLFIWSCPSDPVELVIAETIYTKPNISLSPSRRVPLGGAVTLQCRGRHQNMRFLLYKDGNPNMLQDVEPAGDLAEFPILNVSWRDAGSYRCYYHDKWYLFIWSHPSDPVELVVAGGSEPSAAPGLTRPIIAGVSAAATGLLLLLLLVAFLCYRRTRGGTGPAPRQSSPLAVLKTPAQEDPIYSTID